MGIVGLLRTQPDFDVVAEVATGKEAVERCRSESGDILLLAARLADIDGISSVSIARAVAPVTRTITLAERGAAHCLVLNPPGNRRKPLAPDALPCGPDTDCLQIAVAKGSLGAIRRSAVPEELFAAIRSVASGKVWYDANTAAGIQRLVGGSIKGAGNLLTLRELQVAELISGGRSNKQIAGDLGISEPTVKKHVGRILKKLGLEDRLQIGLHIARNPLLLEPLR
jgi:DNA-binding NarL/FixJ family response regulator